MTTNAIKTQGTQLKRGDGATPTEAFTLIAEITDFDGPDQTAKQMDATSLDSTAREYLAGLRDAGKLSFNMNYVPSNAAQQGVLTDLTNGTKRNFKLVLTDAATPTTIAFAAVVIGHKITGKVDDVVKASVQLQISGAPTWTYGS